MLEDFSRLALAFALLLPDGRCGVDNDGTGVSVDGIVGASKDAWSDGAI